MSLRGEGGACEFIVLLVAKGQEVSSSEFQFVSIVFLDLAREAPGGVFVGFLNLFPRKGWNL